MVIGAFSLAVFALHMLVNGRYGYFVDELYYIACSWHLAWGYVDQPPLIAAAAWLERMTLGDSLHALRLLGAVAAGLTVMLTCLIAQELGARRYAVALACLGVGIAPIRLVLDHLLTMNAFEPPFWMGCALICIKIVKGGNPRLWLLFGLLAGIGLENKHSMLFFGLAFFVGLVLTAERRHLQEPWIWLGSVIALAIFLPNLVCEIRRHFPTIELLRNVQRSGRNVSLSWVNFLLQQVLVMNPIAAPLWLGGLWYFFRHAEGKRFRILGWTYLVILLCLLALNGRVYYLAPAYPMLFAGGAVAFQRWVERHSWNWLKPAYVGAVLVTGTLFAPMACFPILTPEQYIAYARITHLETPRLETHRLGPLPQLYADQFGWKEMAQVVADADYKIPAEERKDCAIFGQNYGQAGAIDFFGAKMGLPGAISGHQNYSYWGPRSYTGACVIVMGGRKERLSGSFDSVEKVGTVYHPYSMPYEHLDLYLCKGPKFGTLQQLWPRLKNWD
jgi:hypothetical protein